ncbi:MAG: hypothetical protein GXO25_06795 [Euryarchaeota archaeon]|nr:hypothetical protein [Euryarchaeota archaeon]
MKSRGVKIAVLISVFAVIGVSLVPLSSGWQDGQTWAYKWVNDWNKTLSKTTQNSSLSGTINGKSVEAYLISYEGKDSTGYKFHYEGGFYSYGYVDSQLSEHSMFGNITTNLKIEAKMVWIDFEGTFHLVRVNSSFTTGDAYYGIKDFSYHIYTKQPLDIYGNASSDMKAANKTINMGLELKLTGTMDITGSVVYKTPVPYLPAGDNFTSAQVFLTSAVYSGHWKLNTQGYLKTWGSQDLFGGGTGGATTVSLDKNVDTDYSGTTNIDGADLTKKGSTVTHSFMVGGLPGKLMNVVVPTTGSNKWDVAGLFSTSWLVESDYSSEDGFYHSANVQYSNHALGMGAIYTTVYGESQPATESDVKTVETNAPAEYGSYEEGMSEYMLLIILSIIVAVAVIVVVLVVRRKRVNSPPPSAAQPEQMQEQPPSDEILDEESP